jgi:iron complex outermembrane recepter protein
MNSLSTRTIRRLLHSISLCAAAAALHGQPVNPAPAAPSGAASPQSAAAPTEAARTGEVVELSPFTVNADDDEGYRATNTLSGSRLNSSLKDTPGAIDVLTAEFLADIGANTLQEALEYSTNFAEDLGDFDSQGVINTVFPGAQSNVNFRTRGLGGTLARNYLETDSRPAFYTVERIDNSSGPNAILFGLGSAGGVANVTTKRARLNRDAYGLGLFFDDNGSRRVTLDVNQAPLPQQFAVRVNAVGNRGKRYRANFLDDTNGIHTAMTWRPFRSTEVRVEYEQEHTTGTVAYPSPHLTNTYVFNWLDRGSPTFALPANWETLTATARNALVNPAGSSTAFTFIGGTASPVVVQNGDRAYILNAATSLFSNSSASSNDANNRQTIDPRFFDDRGNINGPGGRKGVDREVFAVAVDQKVRENVYVNLSVAREESEAFTYQAFATGAANGATVLADANGTLVYPTQIQNLGGTPLSTNAAGQVVNPFAGQYFTQSRWLHRTQHSERETAQATAAWQFRLGKWLGSHRIVGTVSYSERESGSENFRDSWLYAPFSADPIAIANGVLRRRYASPLDVAGFHVPDWREYPELSWTHPTRGKITTGWVTEGENLRTARQFSYLFAAQSRFLRNRLVLTAGYREDKATDYVYGQMRVRPPGWEASNGLLALNRDDIRETETTGPTRTLGGVLHVLSWASLYGNSSTNFGPPRGNVVGPDAVTPPNTAGEGLDAGIKLEILGGKVFVDLGYFDTASNNVAEVLTMNLNTAESIRGAYNAVFPILGNPVGAPPLFNSSDPAAVEALKAAFPMLRPVYSANADLLDQASRGYEARLTANPLRGLRMRATFSKTERERENLFRYTLPMSKQLRAFVADLQAKNPGVNVGGLTSTASPTTTVGGWLDNLDERLDNAIDSLSNNFGGGRLNANLTASYDFPGALKAWGATLSVRYRSGAYVGAYEIREGGVSGGDLVDSVQLFGDSTTDYDLGLRYRVRWKWLRATRAMFQLNVSNLLDETEPIVRRVRTQIIAPGAAAPTEFVPSSYFIRLPRSWNLSARFDF